MYTHTHTDENWDGNQVVMKFTYLTKRVCRLESHTAYGLHCTKLNTECLMWLVSSTAHETLGRVTFIISIIQMRKLRWREAK